jgi:hypothetical protein
METNDKNLKLLNLLKWLYDETRMDFAQLALGKKIEEYEIKQAGVFASELIKLGIVESKRTGIDVFYKWKSEEAPSINLCDQVINAVKEFWREKGLRKETKSAKNETVKPEKETKPLKKEIHLRFPVKEVIKPEIKSESKPENKTPEIKNVGPEGKVFKLSDFTFSSCLTMEAIAEKLTLEEIIYICQYKGIKGQLIVSI